MPRKPDYVINYWCPVCGVQAIVRSSHVLVLHRGTCWYGNAIAQRHPGLFKVLY